MKREVGLWIDHRKTVLVSITAGYEETKVIESNMEKHVRFSAGSSSGSSHGTTEDHLPAPGTRQDPLVRCAERHARRGQVGC